MQNWLDVLEFHFDFRKKAFLIFDDKNILRYISTFAEDILGIGENHLGYISFSELFPPTGKNPQFLIDKDHSFQKVQTILYTLPSGRPQELRIIREQQIHTAGELSGYVVWLEAKARDITGTYRRVSALDPFTNLGWLFDQNKSGAILVDREGIIREYNETIKLFLYEPGDWLGRNIFSFSSVHRLGLDKFFSKILKQKSQAESLRCDIKFIGESDARPTRWSCFPLSDMEGKFIGGIITVVEI